MGGEDPLTPGEIRRALARLESEDRSLAERMTRLAADMLPVKLWDAEHRALSEKLDRHEKAAADDRHRIEKAIEGVQDDLKDMRTEAEKHSEVTWQKVLGLLVALATIAGVVVAVLGQTKGIK